MGRNTLKGTVKVSSYIIAFILMIGIHVIIEKIGANTSSVAKEKIEVHSTRTDENLAKVNFLKNDSLHDISNEIEKVLLKNRD